jgi:predicted metal-dependent peptidase
MSNDKNMKVDRCVVRMVMSQPFYAALALRLNRRVDKSSKTAFWTDGVNLGFNPSLVEEMRDDQVMGAMCRLIEGLGHLHHTRREGRDPKMWNKASASVCTCITKDCGFELAPEDEQFHSDEWKEKSVESVYRIYEAMPKSDNGGDDKQDQQEGDGEGSGQGEGEGDQEGEGQGESGSGGNGAGSGEIRDMPGDALAMQQGEQEWKTATFQAARIAEAQGNCPAHAKRLCDELVNPKVDWRQVLRKFVEQRAKTRYDWSTPNRRYIAQGLFLPSRHSRELGDIVLVMDTSGSIDDEVMKQFAGELGGILEDFPTARVKVLYCDAEVYDGGEFTAQDVPFRLEGKGGGGTDFRPVFNMIRDEMETPKAVIYLTDLLGTFPDYEPEYPVLWGVVNRGESYTHPEFGQCVTVE